MKEYDVEGLEAVWAEVLCGKVRTVIGSVYIPPGNLNALDLLDKVIGNILLKNSNLLIGMDANSRSVLWDDSLIGSTQNHKSFQMGIKLETIIDKYSLLIHNTGVSIYRSGSVSTSPDVTVSVGLTQYGNVVWKTIDDDLRSPHDAILLDVGQMVQNVRKEVIDWNIFDWSAYKSLTSDALRDLIEHCTSNDTLDSDQIAELITNKLHECVSEIATKKVVSVHSRPWIDRDISDQLKLLRQQRRKCRLRKSPANVEKYRSMQKLTVELIQKVECQWWQSQCDRLTSLNDHDK